MKSSDVIALETRLSDVMGTDPTMSSYIFVRELTAGGIQIRSTEYGIYQTKLTYAKAIFWVDAFLNGYRAKKDRIQINV